MPNGILEIYQRERKAELDAEKAKVMLLEKQMEALEADSASMRAKLMEERYGRDEIGKGFV